MIQYAQLNKKKNCLAYFSFFLILKCLLNLILAKIPEPGIPNTPIAGHLTVVSACSGGHLTNYFFKSQIPQGGGGLIAVGFDSYIKS
jgi:hypothetical protein